MEVIIVTGLSGAGKTQAINALEDVGFFCIDNMPPTLIPRFAEMALQINKYHSVAIVTDVRTGEFFSGFFNAIEELKRMDVNVKVLFLDASDDVLEKRYRATRRKHPLSGSDTDLPAAIRDERAMLSPIFEIADYRIDSTYLSTAQMKDEIISLFLADKNSSLRIRCLSFGFKYGVPTEADLLIDVRCLPNPFYLDELREKTGLDAPVRDYVMQFEETQELKSRFFSLVEYLLPLYKKEGKSQLVIGVGCTGGKHRSVAMAEALCTFIKDMGFECKTTHRDIKKRV